MASGFTQALLQSLGQGAPTPYSGQPNYGGNLPPGLSGLRPGSSLVGKPPLRSSPLDQFRKMIAAAGNGINQSLVGSVPSGTDWQKIVDQYLNKPGGQNQWNGPSMGGGTGGFFNPSRTALGGMQSSPNRNVFGQTMEYPTQNRNPGQTQRQNMPGNYTPQDLQKIRQEFLQSRGVAASARNGTYKPTV